MSDDFQKKLLALGILISITIGLSLLAGLHYFDPSNGPTADFDIDHGGDFDSTQCHLSGSFDPGDADRLLIDTGGDATSIDSSTSVGRPVLPGQLVTVYTVGTSQAA